MSHGHAHEGTPLLPGGGGNKDRDHGHSHGHGGPPPARTLSCDSKDHGPPPSLLRDPTIRKLLLASSFCTIFMVVEIIGGLWAHSLAILTDAAHLTSDIVGFAISITAIAIARRPATAQMSWGFHRAEIMGAMFSIFIVWFLTLWLVNEATQRLIARDRHINGTIMLGTALIGLLVNLVMLGIMGEHGHGHGGGHDDGHSHAHGGEDAPGNVNLRAATIHVLGDLIQTVGVVCAAALIWYNPNWWYLDPICTYLFSVLVVFTTLPILKETTMVLMEGTPVGVKPQEVADTLCQVPGVREVHDLHIWSIGSGQTKCGKMKAALAVHLTQDSTSKLNTCDILHRVEEVLRDSYGIHHTTVQIEECESLDCAQSDIQCRQHLHSHRSQPSSVPTPKDATV
jgi:zinc transporter 2